MIIREIFGLSTFRNGFDQDHAYTHKTDNGIVITVNAGHWTHSMAAAHMIAHAPNSIVMQVVADSHMGKASAADRPFACRVTEEIKLLPAPAAAPV